MEERGSPWQGPPRAGAQRVVGRRPRRRRVLCSTRRRRRAGAATPHSHQPLMGTVDTARQRGRGERRELRSSSRSQARQPGAAQSRSCCRHPRAALRGGGPGTAGRGTQRPHPPSPSPMWFPSLRPTVVAVHAHGADAVGAVRLDAEVTTFAPSGPPAAGAAREGRAGGGGRAARGRWVRARGLGPPRLVVPAPTCRPADRAASGPGGSHGPPKKCSRQPPIGARSRVLPGPNGLDTAWGVHALLVGDQGCALRAGAAAEGLQRAGAQGCASSGRAERRSRAEAREPCRGSRPRSAPPRARPVPQ
jgi:hypothetical protein